MHKACIAANKFLLNAFKQTSTIDVSIIKVICFERYVVKAEGLYQPIYYVTMETPGIIQHIDYTSTNCNTVNII